MLTPHGLKVKRQAGAIPPILGDKYPKRFVVFDTEAYRSLPVNGVELQSLRLGVACYYERCKQGGYDKVNDYQFTTAEGLISYLESLTRKDKTLYIYAHNLRYDLQLSGIFTALVAEGWRASLFVIESPPTFIKLKRGRMSLTFVDTFNYWQFSLAQMGEQLGLPKLTIDFRTDEQSKLMEYCQRDVELLANYIIKFITFLQDNDLAGLGLTLASQAFRSYRYRFMPCEIILHNRDEVLKLERDGYYGGRCEAFYIGERNGEDYYKLDVNSMYPYVMKSHLYPTEFVAYAEDIPLQLVERRLDDYYCLADCTLSTATPAYAVVKGVKLLFPVGRYRAILHHHDILQALQRGDIQMVNRFAYYQQGDIFTPYVNYFYALKLQAESQGDKITRQQAKILLNSLYGKFGQRQVVSKIVPYTEGLRFERLTGFSEALGCNVEVNYLGNSIELRYKEGEAYYSSPVIAGAVTAYARGYLWDLITHAGVNNVYYVDTDSLIVNRQGYEHLSSYLDVNRLGGLKLEGVSNHLLIHSVKDYVFGGEAKVKGVPKIAVKLSDNSWQYEQFRGAKTWMLDGFNPGVEVYTRTKERVHAYDKGEVQADGTVLPLRFWGEG